MTARKFWMLFLICFTTAETLTVLSAISILPIWLGGVGSPLVLYLGMIVEELGDNPPHSLEKQWHSELNVRGVMYVAPIMLASIGRATQLASVLSVVTFLVLTLRLIHIRAKQLRHIS